ncbi:BA75_05032T0 [Komagataella pastoris]|uniref:BA75_05032T0 n=1 Tax=Komagataella pastoris TaxID=4922 RepID=A0A1B2JI48_PICPA|nr:BA75_05032T0 [Komagataella pastoris]
MTSLYTHQNSSRASSGSARRVSAHNPFRRNGNNQSSSSVGESNDPAFKAWRDNVAQLEDLSNEATETVFVDMGMERPQPTSTNSSNQMNKYSNNPFAEDLLQGNSGGAADPPIRQQAPPINRQAKPPRENPELPPSYEEVAGSSPTKEYPPEKPLGSQEERKSSRSHNYRSHSHPRRQDDSKQHSQHRSRREREKEKERQRYIERDRQRSNKGRSKKDKDPLKPSKNLDTIDKLDVTGFFGGGGFHHDGPFDACTPHRNTNKKAPPVMAFPVDGPNSTIKGMGPLHSKEEQMDIVFGISEQDPLYAGSKNSTRARGMSSNQRLSQPMYQNGNSTSTSLPSVIKHDPSVVQFDSNVKAEPVHGQTTLGLGSSTFLDGAPASKDAELQDHAAKSNELSRKKSLLRRMKAASPPTARRTSEDNNIYHKEGEERNGANGLLKRVRSLKVSRK